MSKKISHVKTEYRQGVWIMYIIVFSLNFLTVNELSTERHFIVWAAKLNQHIYNKGILTSKFGPKDLLLWKRVSSFVSTEDENLWIPSRLMCFNGPTLPERSPLTPPKRKYFTHQKQKAVWRELYPNFLNYCS